MAKNDYCNSVCICIGICSFIGIIFVYAWPISEIVIGSLYIKQVECYFFINIALWLIIKAILSIFLVTCLVIYFYYDEKLFFRFYCYILIMLFVFIYLGWLITGSVLLYNCFNDTPKELNIYVYLSLAFGYIGFLNMLKFSHAKE